MSLIVEPRPTFSDQIEANKTGPQTKDIRGRLFDIEL